MYLTGNPSITGGGNNSANKSNIQIDAGASLVIYADGVIEFGNKVTINNLSQNPSIQILGLAFLILIGFMLMTESMHLSNAQLVGQHVGAVPKGYLYFAIAFSLAVEFINMRMDKNKK